MGHRHGKLTSGLTLLAVAVATLAAPDNPTHAQEAPVTVQVLGTNDFHGRLTLSSPLPGQDCPALARSGGAALLAGAVEQLRADHPNTVFSAAGDLIGASLFESFIAKDRPTLVALNAAGLDVSAVGNHEFDQGYADLTERVMAPYDPVTNPFGGAEWAYLGANVRNASNGSAALPESWTVDFGDIRVGFVGAVTEHLPELVSPAGIAGLDIEAPVVAANRVADELKQDQGADIVVLLVHEGAATTSFASAVDPASDFGKIVLGADENIDAIISGHTHLAYNHQVPVQAWIDEGRDVTSRPVVSAGQYAFGLNQLLFDVDPASGDVLSVTPTLLPLTTAQFTADEAVVQIVCDAVAAADGPGSQVLGDITGPFNRAKMNSASTTTPIVENRGGESTLGNLVAEVQRWATADLISGGAQIAFMNPGGLRADMVGNAGSPPTYPADLTYRQAATVQPFANTLVNMRLTGAQIKTVLEQQWQPAGSSRPFLRLGTSDGFSYTYDPNAPAGAHIRQMVLNGEPIDLAATYSVTVNSFLAAGGDNFFELANGTSKRDTGKIDLQSMVDYMAANSPASPDYAQHSVGISFPAGAPAAYEPGQTVRFDVSSLLMAAVPPGGPGTSDATVTVELDGTPVGPPFAVDNTVGTGNPFDEYGTAAVAFALPPGTPPGGHVLTIIGTTTGTIATVPLVSLLASSRTELAASALTQVYGSDERATLTATVTSSGLPVGTPPTGSVQFVTADGTVLATVPLAATGTATLTLPANQPAGTLTVTARYAGVPGVVTGSQSTPVTITIEKATSTTVLASTRTTQRGGTRVPTLLISATGLNNGQVPRGYVEFRDGDRVVSRTGMIFGLSLYVVPHNVSQGAHTYTATFVPFDTANYAGSTSNGVTINVIR